MTDNNKAMDPKTVAAFKAMDGQSVTARTHELVEDADGAPAGVAATEWRRPTSTSRAEVRLPDTG